MFYKFQKVVLIGTIEDWGPGKGLRLESGWGLNLGPKVSDGLTTGLRAVVIFEDRGRYGLWALTAFEINAAQGVEAAKAAASEWLWHN